MTPAPIIYGIHGSDASQHVEKMQNVMTQFKADRRIGNYFLLEIQNAANELPERFQANDLIVLFLTYKLEERRNELTTLLSRIRTKFPDSTIAEIIIDNVPFVNEYITLPSDLKPIRNTQDADAAWLNIEEKLRQILPPVEQVKGQKYLKIAGIAALSILFIFILYTQFNKNNRAQPEGPITTVEEATAEPTPANNSSNDPSSDFPGGSTRNYTADFSQWNVAQNEYGVVSLGFGNSYVLQPNSNTWIGSNTQPVVPGLTGDFVLDVRFKIEEPNPSSALSLKLTGDGNDAESIDVYFDFWGPGNVDYSLSKGRVRSGGGLAVPHAITEETIAERVKAPAGILNHDWAQGGKLTLKREGLEMQFFINDVFVRRFQVSTFQVAKTSIGVAFASKVTITSIEGRLKN